MKPSNDGFRRVMALVRIALGLAFCVYGTTKLFDPNFFATGFQFALTRASGTAAEWYSPVIRSIWIHPGMFAVGVGMLELFLGTALLLGLATRPACLVGMVYMMNKAAITWHVATGQGNGIWQFLDAHMEQFTLFCLLLLLMVGHAGETWGLGAFYHRAPADDGRISLRDRPEYRYLYEPEEREQRGEAETSRR
jgi:uncharacterized membrane protein YphA (DoxX/SURF4 family)